MYRTLTYSPFAPFMIVFCEAITTLNVVDLNNLEQFVLSVQPTEGASKSTVALYHLCLSFYEVAKVFITESLSFAQAHTATERAPEPVGDYKMQPLGERTSNQFTGATQLQAPSNDYNPDDPNFNHSLNPDNFMTWSSEDWFLPDQYMLGLLDPNYPL